WHMTGHAMLCLVGGAFGVLGLIAGCLVFARGFAALKQHGCAAYSVITGVLFLGAFSGIASGSKQSAVVLAFYGAVVVGWAWISVIAARLMTELPKTSSIG